MSNFKIVCGLNPYQEVIINIEQVGQIYFFESEDKREVVVESIDNKRWILEYLEHSKALQRF